MAIVITAANDSSAKFTERDSDSKFISSFLGCSISGSDLTSPPVSMKPYLSKMGRRTGVPPISWLMQAALSRPKLISLAAGFTDNATLPVLKFRASAERNFALAQNRPARVAIRHHRRRNESAPLTAKHLQKLDLRAVTPSRSSLVLKTNRGRGRRTRTKTYSPEHACSSPAARSSCFT